MVNKLGIQRKLRQHRRKDHSNCLNKVSIEDIEEFFRKKTGIDFTDERSGAVIFKFYREKEIDSYRAKSPTPDLTVVYFHNGFKLAFIEVKARTGNYTFERLEAQRTNILGTISNTRILENFLLRLMEEDKHLTKERIGQIAKSKIEYYTAKIKPSGNLIPLYS